MTRRGHTAILAFVLSSSTCAPAEPAPHPAVLPAQGDGRAVSPVAADDLDGDGLPDAREAALAERFAPIVIHSSAETNLPTDVDSFLRSTSLWFHDDACRGKDHFVLPSPGQGALLGHTERSCGESIVTSDGSRSLRKHRTFVLPDVDDEAKRGSRDTRAWKTYVHAYPNDLGGVTLQYWRFYAYNRAVASHGGDWEGAHVVLGADGAVAQVRLLGHRSIAAVSPRDLRWEGDHPVIYSEIGGHTSRANGDEITARGCGDVDPCTVTLDDFHTRITQETWTGGSVAWPDGHVTAGGGLVNVGEKCSPRNGQVFVRYSGLWGSPGHFYATSGYWGPAFNETSMREDGFVTAWCAGMAGPLDQKRECFATQTEP
jgi:hypothetical protein